MINAINVVNRVMSSSTKLPRDSSEYEVVFRLPPSGLPFSRRMLRVNFNSDKFSARNSPWIESMIAQEWDTRLEKNPKLFNLSKYRFHSFIHAESHLHMNVGLCDYRQFLGTNRHTETHMVQPRLVQEGLGNPHACFADPLGNSAVVVTKDGLIPIAQRSALHTAEFSSWWDVPGGHPEPSRCEELRKSVVDELFDSIQEEVHEELNIPHEFIGEPGLLGLVRAKSSWGKPSLILYVI